MFFTRRILKYPKNTKSLYSIVMNDKAAWLSVSKELVPGTLGVFVWDHVLDWLKIRFVYKMSNVLALWSNFENVCVTLWSAKQYSVYHWINSKHIIGAQDQWLHVLMKDILKSMPLVKSRQSSNLELILIKSFAFNTVSKWEHISSNLIWIFLDFFFWMLLVLVLRNGIKWVNLIYYLLICWISCFS